MKHRHAHAHLRRRPEGVELVWAPSPDDDKLFKWKCPRCGGQNREYYPDFDDTHVTCKDCDTGFVVESYYG